MHVIYYSPTTEVRAVISVQHCHGGQVGCLTITWDYKASHLNITVPLLPEEKVQGSTFCWKMHAHSFLGLLRHYSPGVQGQKDESQVQLT